MEPSNTRSLSESQNELENPLQFRLIDAFAIMTIGSLILALVAPFLQLMSERNVLRLVGLASLQTLAIGGVMIWAAQQRKALRAKSGRRLGLGYCSQIRWRYWPVCAGLCLVFLAALLQLILGIAALSQFLTPSYLVYQVQLGAFTGFVVSRYVWRLYPNTLEFFENGVSLNGRTLIPWDRAAIRDSQFFPDRIVVVLRESLETVGTDMRLVYVEPEMRQRIYSSRERAEILS